MPLAPSTDVAPAGIRPFAANDAPSVAALFRRVFMRERRVSEGALAACFCDVFLTDRYGSLGNGSLVYAEEDGQVTGFIGVVPALFNVQGRQARIAMVGSLMVDDHQNNPLKGARLVRAVATGGYDMVLSETANATSLRMWNKIGSRSVPGYSLDYLKIFHPARFAVHLARRRHPRADLAMPLARAVDRLTAGVMPPSITLDAAYSEADVDPAEAAALALRLTETRGMGPALDGTTLARRLEHALTKQGYGVPVVRAVSHRGGAMVGLYFYHAHPGGMAHVQQLLAEPRHMMESAGRMIADARARGAIALKGRAEPASTVALGAHQCVFTQRSSMIAHTTQEDLLPPLLSGDAWITGLAGETWMQLIGHSFPPIKHSS